ncbi:hypothetical protein P378_01430 [Desulforamulus profundi]|uniref:Addiction module protein n=1 Tax=Desulforamulus profundi TaxID=1383067 RepID=A0A2C6MBI3_9FIRM|nr:hypothetical protein [Desulforamulus profundi]MCL5781341.1 hypothetical protein [Bacillota bacterium]PHJ39777.1 hypothetical protein P378_01430 [Desulforamulus profundi]
MNPTRRELHNLIDALPDYKVRTVKQIIEIIIRENPWEELLASPPEVDEPLTEEEKIAINEAERDLAAGLIKPWEQVKKELGL